MKNTYVCTNSSGSSMRVEATSALEALSLAATAFNSSFDYHLPIVAESWSVNQVASLYIDEDGNEAVD